MPIHLLFQEFFPVCENILIALYMNRHEVDMKTSFPEKRFSHVSYPLSLHVALEKCETKFILMYFSTSACGGSVERGVAIWPLDIPAYSC